MGSCTLRLQSNINRAHCSPGEDRGDKCVNKGGETKEREGSWSDSWRRRIVRHVEGNPQRRQGLNIGVSNGEETYRLENSAVSLEVQRHGASVRPVSGKGNGIRLMLGKPWECTLGLRMGCEPVGHH
ncbi:hypothetical protein LIER_32200 [Lithospermum erythrorhizon]|uniref:Uncharacterized protein n=1 Tax=Lithospermum erythrorhizon TaxID=34254 RepID=A0AAV3RUG9_LITER